MTASSTITVKTHNPQDSVVTADRFGEGFASFSEWMDSIELNKEKFQMHYDEWEHDQADIDKVRQYVESKGIKALCIGEDWCPDVWRGLPVISRIGELTGMEVRLFQRDENPDIMDEFLKDGEFESIPVVVLYDADHNYLGHWIERADQANAEMQPLLSMLHGHERGSDEWQEARNNYLTKTVELAQGWRNAQVKEMLALLDEVYA
jgi:hypothetical protein